MQSVEPYVREGCWPDCDMLPLGRICINTPGYDQNARYCRLTKDEQITMMTLWCIFRSPLMIGGELRDNDEWTFNLLTNHEVLGLLKHSYGARQIMRTGDTIVWTSNGIDGSKYVAFFNISFAFTNPSISLSRLGLRGTYKVRNLWKHEDTGVVSDYVSANVNPHGAVLYKLTKID